MFSSILKRFIKIGVKIVFLDFSYTLEMIVGTMVRIGLLVFNSTLKMFVRTMVKKFSCIILTLGIFVKVLLNSFLNWTNFVLRVFLDHVQYAQMDESSGTNSNFYNLEIYFNFYFNSFRMFYLCWSQVFFR